MINQNVSWFFLPKFHKTSNCPFYRPSGVFSRNLFMNIMHIHVGNMQFYTLASKRLFLLFIPWAPEMGWNCPIMPHRAKNDSLYENRIFVSENKYIILPMVKKKSIMRKVRGFLLSHRSFPWSLLNGWDPLRRFCVWSAARGSPSVPAFLDTLFIFAIYY